MVIYVNFNDFPPYPYNPEKRLCYGLKRSTILGKELILSLQDEVDALTSQRTQCNSSVGERLFLPMKVLEAEFI